MSLWRSKSHGQTQIPGVEKSTSPLMGAKPHDKRYGYREDEELDTPITQCVTSLFSASCLSMKNHLGLSRHRKMAAETQLPFPFQFLPSLSSSSLIFFKAVPSYSFEEVSVKLLWWWATENNSGQLYQKGNWMTGCHAAHKSWQVVGEPGWEQDRSQDSSGSPGSRTWSIPFSRHWCWGEGALGGVLSITVSLCLEVKVLAERGPSLG